MSVWISVLVGAACLGCGLFENGASSVNKSSSSTLTTFLVSLFFCLAFLVTSRQISSFQFSRTQPFRGYDIACVFSFLLFVVFLVLLLVDTTSLGVSITLMAIGVISFFYHVVYSFRLRKLFQSHQTWLSSAPKMNGIQIKHFGRVSDIVQKVSNLVKPRLGFTPNGMVVTPDPEAPQLLIKVLACSLSPSDYRMWSGKARLFKSPKYGFPYVPLGDVCGRVVEVEQSEQNSKFKVGDVVVATWDAYGIDCLADYAVISSKLATLAPDGMDPCEAAALANSAMLAFDAVESVEFVENERILVLGASGGFGTCLVQFLRRKAPTCYIAATSTDRELVQNVLKVDKFINYQEQNWWEMEEFVKQPFDKVFDCAEGAQGFRKACETAGVVKCGNDGGIWMAVVINDWDITITNVCHMFCSFMGPLLKRIISNKFKLASQPKYMPFLLDANADKLKNMLEMHAKGEFKVVLDPEAPFEYTEDGVKKAFQKHEDRKGHGKIVIKVADE